MHPLRRVPRKVQTRRIEIGGANRTANECGDQNPKKAAERQGDMPLGGVNRAVC